MQSRRPLPWYKGPKLSPFKYRDSTRAHVEFLKYLGHGLHPEVFQVRIDGSIYALKVFRFLSVDFLVPMEYPEPDGFSAYDVFNENDPFNAECRAYGRLKEEGREDLAVKCHGYLLLDAAQEASLASLGYDEWRRQDCLKRGEPLRAIMKELLPTDQGNFTFNMIPQMRRDIEDINRLGIVVHDLRIDNYLAGQIIDFSQAKTQPHHFLDWSSTQLSREAIMDYCVQDIQRFDGIVDEWNKKHPNQIFWRVFLASHVFGRRLRNRSRFGKFAHQREGAKFYAAFYDWRQGLAKGKGK